QEKYFRYSPKSAAGRSDGPTTIHLPSANHSRTKGRRRYRCGVTPAYTTRVNHYYSPSATVSLLPNDGRKARLRGGRRRIPTVLGVLTIAYNSLPNSCGNKPIDLFNDPS